MTLNIHILNPPEPEAFQYLQKSLLAEIQVTEGQSYPTLPPLRYW